MFKNMSKKLKVVYGVLFILAILVTVVSLSYAYITAKVSNSVTSKFTVNPNNSTYYLNITNNQNLTLTVNENMVYGTDYDQLALVSSNALSFKVKGPSGVTTAKCSYNVVFVYDSSSYAYTNNSSFFFLIGSTYYALPSKPSSGTNVTVASLSGTYTINSTNTLTNQVYFKSLTSIDQGALVGKTIKGQLTLNSLSCTKAS